MEWVEANSLPKACLNCAEEDCYNCEHAGERWYLSKEDDLNNRRKLLIRSIERLQKQVAAIDKELAQMKR